MKSRDEGNKKRESRGSRQGGMKDRGVTRPMMQMREMRSDARGHIGEHRHARGMMSEDQRKEMLGRHHTQTLWIYWMLIVLGVWMIMTPLTFDYGKNTVEPSGGREVWLSLSERVAAMKWSDLISGFLLVVFAWRALTPNRPVSVWTCCFIGIWISFAPLLFWAPTPSAYLNGTLVGALVIALTVLIPGMPNMIMYMKMGSEVPEGWSYNPSSWAQRWIMIVTGFLGWIVSRYLASFQLGYMDQAWDPFFGPDTMEVLNSSMSQSLPISDAGLGALAYTFEFLMGFMGSPARWRTMPWMVAVFGILVIPLGLVHIFLVISQPLTVGAWCTFCLLAAGIMLPMIPLEADEVVAMGQHMVVSTRNGEKFWKVFWKGGNPVEMNNDQRSPNLKELPQNFRKVFLASVWGMSVPRTLLLSAALGVWLMFAPAVFGVGIETTAADISHLCGALIVVISVISMGEVLRAGRYLNVLTGLVVAIATWFASNGTFALNLNATVAGLFAVILSIPCGIKRERYGLWDKYVR